MAQFKNVVSGLDGSGQRDRSNSDEICVHSGRPGRTRRDLGHPGRLHIGAEDVSALADQLLLREAIQDAE